MIPLLQGDLLLPLVARCLVLFQAEQLLLQHQLGAGRAGRRQQRQRFDIVLARGCLQRDPRALSVRRHNRPVAVDVVAPFEVSDYRQDIVDVRVERGRFRAAAALTHAALVVTQHQVAGFGQRRRQIGKDRDPAQVLVAVNQPDAGHQQHRRPAAGPAARGR